MDRRAHAGLAEPMPPTGKGLREPHPDGSGVHPISFDQNVAPKAMKLYQPLERLTCPAARPSPRHPERSEGPTLLSPGAEVLAHLTWVN